MSTRYKSSEIYHIDPKELRKLRLELTKRDRDNVRGEDKDQARKRYDDLKAAIAKEGVRDDCPIEVQLLRKEGKKDKLLQGHHRLNIAIELGLPVVPVRFVFEPRIPMKIKLSKVVLDKIYGIPFKGGGGIPAEPTEEEIEAAIRNKKTDDRDYQANLGAIEAEISSQSNGNEVEKARLLRSYHAQRIAYFALNGWSDPITVTPDFVLTDGGHRFRAARHLGYLDIEAEIR